MDCVVVSWIFNTISPNLLDDIHQRDSVSARAAWLGIEQQFLNNRESRAMLLDTEFRTLSQGALSIDDYCCKMKGMADALADLSEPIPDRSFVLNLLRGLNELFQFMTQFITRQRPFPSFAEARADLRLAELNMPTPSSPASALVTTTSGQPSTLTSFVGSSSSRPPQAAGGNSFGNNRGRRRRGGRGHGGAPGGPAGGSQWPSVFNPWTGSIHMWLGPSTGGPCGLPLRPGPLPQQALLTGAPSPPYSLGSFYQAPPHAPAPWDIHSLAASFSTVNFNPPPSTTDWVLDSGASSHVASNPGMITLSPSTSFPSFIIVGNGTTLPVLGTGYSTLLGPFRLNMSFSLLTSSKTSFTFVNSLLITVFQLSLTL
jgi:hypothetical protein